MNNEDALSLLKEMIEAVDDPMRASETGGDLYCVFCGEWSVTTDEAHKPDCVYVRIKAFLGEGKTENGG